MKGTIVTCLQELVEHKAGKPAWIATLEAAGKAPDTKYLTTATVPDSEVMQLMSGAATVLKISPQDAMNAFGEYWGSVYAPRVYQVYYRAATSAREFLLNMNEVHVALTLTSGAAPPKFTFETRGPKDLEIRYSSARGLAGLMPSLIKGVGKYYKEQVVVHAAGNVFNVTFT
jgi:hypothetical protein